MKAYVGIDQTSGKYYALAELPSGVRRRTKPGKSWDAYLRNHHGIALAGSWRPFPRPEKEGELRRSGDDR